MIPTKPPPTFRDPEKYVISILHDHDFPHCNTAALVIAIRPFSYLCVAFEANVPVNCLGLYCFSHYHAC